MASSSNLNPAFAYTVLYVKDVAESVDFYAKAFGYSVRRLDESHRWGELESGHTTIAFTPIHQHETDDLTGAVHAANRSKQERPPLEVCFVYTDVDAAYKRAVENGAVAVSEPEMKEWGQKVGYVRDIDGIIIRMGSHVKPAKLD
ncbi:dessication-induced 1VOC superfamily protein [Trifolium repens]|nr:dessication-induced 1VOC superfamily protein [Trifolium repens]